MASLQTVSTGFMLAVLFGFLTGLSTACCPPLEKRLMPLVDLVRPVAAIALFPLFIAVFGLGREAQVATILWAAWPPVLISTVDGVKRIPRELIDAARLDGAYRLRLVSQILTPLAAPEILTGLRVAMGSAWISLVAAEMLGSNQGLGFLVLMKSQVFDYPGMVAGILTIGALGFLLNRSLDFVQRRVTF